MKTSLCYIREIENLSEGATGLTGATGANSGATNNALVRNITDSEISDNILNTLSSRLLESILYPSSNMNSNDRFMFDPSNNILMYETTIRNPNSSSHDSENDNNNLNLIGFH